MLPLMCWARIVFMWTISSFPHSVLERSMATFAFKSVRWFLPIHAEKRKYWIVFRIKRVKIRTFSGNIHGIQIRRIERYSYCVQHKTPQLGLFPFNCRNNENYLWTCIVTEFLLLHCTVSSRLGGEEKVHTKRVDQRSYAFDYRLTSSSKYYCMGIVVTVSNLLWFKNLPLGRCWVLSSTETQNERLRRIAWRARARKFHGPRCHRRIVTTFKIIHFFSVPNHMGNVSVSVVFASLYYIYTSTKQLR